MKLRAGVFGVLVLFVSVSLATAQEPRRPGRNLLSGLQPQPLLTADMKEKLKLSDAQQKSLDKLDSEYNDRQKEATKSIQDAIDKLGGGGDFNTIRELSGQMREVRGKLDELRKDYDGKVKEVLKEEQKKTFDELAQQRPRQGGFPFQPGGFPGGQPGGFPSRTGGDPGTILNDTAARRLNLTEEQKKKLAEIQKKVDEDLNKLLTEEQRKQLESMKQQNNQRFPRRPRNGEDPN